MKKNKFVHVVIDHTFSDLKVLVISSQAHTLATSLTPYLKEELVKEYYLPLLNLGGTYLLPLAVEMFSQLKEAMNSAATTVFKKEYNPGGDECVRQYSLHSTPLSIHYYKKNHKHRRVGLSGILRYLVHTHY